MTARRRGIGGAGRPGGGYEGGWGQIASYKGVRRWGGGKGGGDLSGKRGGKEERGLGLKLPCWARARYAGYTRHDLKKAG